MHATQKHECKKINRKINYDEHGNLIYDYLYLYYALYIYITHIVLIYLEYSEP